MNSIIVKFSSDEISPLVNILNEVCHGIPICDYEKTIGFKKNLIINLLNKIFEEKNKKKTIIDLNDLELTIIFKSFNEVFQQIDEWEFETRMGITIPEAKNIREKLINAQIIRQINLIYNQIILFKSGKTDLKFLVRNLAAYFKNIDSVDKTSVEFLKNEWDNLEVIYEKGGCEREVNLNSFQKEIDKSVDRMEEISKKMLHSYIEFNTKIDLPSALFLKDNWIMCPECIDAWQETSNDAVVICPKCYKSFRNPVPFQQ